MKNWRYSSIEARIRWGVESPGSYGGIVEVRGAVRTDDSGRKAKNTLKNHVKIEISWFSESQIASECSKAPMPPILVYSTSKKLKKTSKKFHQDIFKSIVLIVVLIFQQKNKYLTFWRKNKKKEILLDLIMRIRYQQYFCT